jgi:alpha-methylacyl-CoA racemase
MAGPLSGLRVLELGGIGPGPHAAMVLGDLGADVVRVERPHGGLALLDPGAPDWSLRNRRSVAADLKNPSDLASVLQLASACDVIIEGFRPGVAERLGLGPASLRGSNPRLVYARMTGWGQDGPLALRAGHDINYLSLTGVLHAIGPADDKPVPPLNLVGDFGGGSAYLVVGILAALFEREQSSLGQVVDAAIVDGVSSLAQSLWTMFAGGSWQDRRAANVLDGGAPFYDTYACADGGFVAVGSLEPQCFAALLGGLGLDAADLPEQWDRSGWPQLREVFTRGFAVHGRDYWADLFLDTDACVTPVLSLHEAPHHPHLKARGTLTEYGGVTQAAPAPRFSRTKPSEPTAPGGGEVDIVKILSEWSA